MWLPGECFEDAANEILICVESVTTEGFTVRVASGDFGERLRGWFGNAWRVTTPGAPTVEQN